MIIDNTRAIKTYTVSKKDLIQLIALDLKENASEIDLQFNLTDTSNERYNSPCYEVTCITITHSPSKK